MVRRMTFAGIALLLLALGVVACGDDSTTPPPPGEEAVPPPSSAAELMTRFKTAYETLDFELLRSILDQDHETLLQPSTTDQFPDVGPTLDLTEELRIHSRMFSGEPLTDPDGYLVPGVVSISFQAFEQQNEWGPPHVSDSIQDAETALYDVIVLMSRGQTYSTIKIQGQIQFYVAGFDSVHDGATHRYYRMRAQKDLTDARKTEEATSWGAAKALFR